ncbi:MAG: hypothetical protein IJ567_03385 [Lachnospiraceae bacterium]|nr:hypothetical protein [Lachnospiraceae bacterium]
MKFLKRMIAVATVAMMMVPGLSVRAEGVGNTLVAEPDEKVIAQKVEEFMEIFEEIDMDSTEKIDKIRSMSSAAAIENEASYLNTIMLLLERGDIVLAYSENDITEYGKVINCEFADFERDETGAAIDVTVTKTWNYAFSDIESGAMDHYKFEFIYDLDDHDWKIENIQGISFIVTDYRLQELGDQITVEEKEQYLGEFEEEIKADEIIVEPDDPDPVDPSELYGIKCYILCTSICIDS